MSPRRKAAAAVAALVLVAVAWALAGRPGGTGGDGARSYWTYDLSVATGEAPPRIAAEGCAPFFDDDSATPYRPPAPALDSFDRAVLRACGPIRGRATPAEFEALILDHMASIRPRLPARLRRLDDRAIHRRLAEIWLGRDGFDHIFCGEWEKGRIGGLHFRGRYLQLQREGTACFRATDRLELEPGLIYTIGVASADGAEFSPIKGYGLAQSALDVLALGTAGFAACCAPGRGWLPYRDRFSRQVFVPSDEAGPGIMNRLICGADDRTGAAGAALVTLFPDASPREDYPECRF
ncbi:MAG: EndoU domain-containing protein [Rhodospirillaceae bacterium]|jgi:hypothetical protein|nr:EndoU domain-containing protein [Rhodospirillaceae bacterium]MBT6117474.1 EndoU domain-containing protein [Rhodospirillaceae bacterium]